MKAPWPPEPRLPLGPVAAALIGLALVLQGCARTEQRAVSTSAATPTRAAPSPAAPPTATPRPSIREPATPAPAAPGRGSSPPRAASVPTPPAPAPATREPLRPFDPASLALDLRPVVSGLARPLAIATAHDGSNTLYVAEKGGLIWRIPEDTRQAALFLDLRSLVRATGSEQGLLGIAFHPRYVENGLFYVNYTDRQGDTVVARYQRSGADPTVADPASATVLLQVDQPYANHNGGHLLFGPDGYLWIGLGDGGSGGDPHGNAQNGGTLLGKMLRLDVDGGTPYAIPPDNPFASTPGFRPEIWAIGLRNPWRYSFDRATGDLFIADVGQNAWEEVNYVPAGSSGLNFGWNILEANHCFRAQSCNREGLVAPVAEYDHGQGCSITGGYVYRGAVFPEMAGLYLFADFCSGRLWALGRQADGSWLQALMLETGRQVSTFGEDEAGELYLAGFDDGTIYQVVARPRP